MLGRDPVPVSRDPGGFSIPFPVPVPANFEAGYGKDILIMESSNKYIESNSIDLKIVI